MLCVVDGGWMKKEYGGIGGMKLTGEKRAHCQYIY